MFTDMVTILTPGSKGVAELEHYSVSELESAVSSWRGFGTAAKPYCILRVNGQTMMSDTDHERSSNYQVVRQAKGSVLIGGLGIGMILVPLLKNPKVTSVTVLEKYQDCIDLVLPQLSVLEGAEKLTVIQADCFEWVPPKGVKFDTIYWDIWPTICTDNLPAITKLKRRYASRLNPGGWQGAWVEKQLRERAKVQEKDARRWRAFRNPSQS